MSSLQGLSPSAQEGYCREVGMKVAFGWRRLEKVNDKYLLKTGSLVTISARRNSTDVKSHHMFRGTKMPVANKQQLRIISSCLIQRPRGNKGSTFYSSLAADFSNQFSKKDYDIVVAFKKNKMWNNVVKAHNR